jgi:pimeloyl-ACP methyl ester carboxylesterase
VLLRASLFVFTGCAAVLSAPTPMHTVSSQASPTRQARCLLVLLPGFSDSDTDFDRHGFIADIHARKLSVDTISANATIGYYAKRTILDRIETDVLAPMRAKHYEQTWFMGISMGGLGTVLVAEQHDKELTGLILMAPYLGDDDVIDEISKAGGVAKWRPPAVVNPEDYQREVWRWLQHATANPTTAPAIYLASGDQDPHAPAHRLLATVVQDGHLFRTRGNHDWGPWRVLWAKFLDTSDFRTRCGEPGSG